MEPEPAALMDAFAYERAAVEAGEIWRLFTCHLVHVGPSHLAGNLIALAAVWMLFARELRGCGWRVALIVAATVGLGVHYLQTDVARYVGLSGVWHGLLAAGALRAWPKRRALATVVLALLGGKLAYECGVGPLPGAEALVGGSIIVAAHAFGALAGVGAAQAERICVSSSRASCT